MVAGDVAAWLRVVKDTHSCAVAWLSIAGLKSLEAGHDQRLPVSTPDA